MRLLCLTCLLLLPCVAQSPVVDTPLSSGGILRHGYLTETRGLSGARLRAVAGFERSLSRQPDGVRPAVALWAEHALKTGAHLDATEPDFSRAGAVVWWRPARTVTVDVKAAWASQAGTEHWRSWRGHLFAAPAVDVHSRAELLEARWWFGERRTARRGDYYLYTPQSYVSLRAQEVTANGRHSGLYGVLLHERLSRRLALLAGVEHGPLHGTVWRVGLTANVPLHWSMGR